MKIKQIMAIIVILLFVNMPVIFAEELNETNEFTSGQPIGELSVDEEEIFVGSEPSDTVDFEGSEND